MPHAVAAANISQYQIDGCPPGGQNARAPSQPMCSPSSVKNPTMHISLTPELSRELGDGVGQGFRGPLAFGDSLCRFAVLVSKRASAIMSGELSG